MGDLIDLNSLYYYDNGILRYKTDRSYRFKAGMPVGSKDKDGYLRTTFNGKNLKIHRVIWEMHYGEIPDGLMIDHVNGIKDDNRISNLRLATNSQNQHNRDVKCFWRQQGKWIVRVSGKFFGYYDCKELAELVASEARELMYGNFKR